MSVMQLLSYWHEAYKVIYDQKYIMEQLQVKHHYIKHAYTTPNLSFLKFFDYSSLSNVTSKYSPQKHNT